MGDSFDADWLTLREPLDRRARSRALVHALQHRFAGHDALRITDLGAGTGASLRFLAPRLGPLDRQSWRLVDADSGLLALAQAQCSTRFPDLAAVSVRQADLAAEPLAKVIADADLVTASALLDLVSADWLQAAVDAIAARGAAAWFSLSVDGGKGFAPPIAADWRIIRAFKADQGRDKGFGPALGGRAGAMAARLFRAAGYRVLTGAAPWRAGPAHAAFQIAFITGMADAARSRAPGLAGVVDDWLTARLSAVDRGQSFVRVGHLDILAVPS